MTNKVFAFWSIFSLRMQTYGPSFRQRSQLQIPPGWAPYFIPSPHEEVEISSVSLWAATWLVHNFSSLIHGFLITLASKDFPLLQTHLWICLVLFKVDRVTQHFWVFLTRECCYLSQLTWERLKCFLSFIPIYSGTGKKC